MQERKMAGPWVPIPGEVFDLFRTLKRTVRRTCFTAYGYMLNEFSVEQDPDVEGEWVLGRIRASHRDIAKVVDVEWSWFRKRIWPALVELGLVRDAEDGLVELPKLYKKGQAYIIPLQVVRDVNTLKAEIRAEKAEMRAELRNLKEMLSAVLDAADPESARLIEEGDESQKQKMPPKLGGKIGKNTPICLPATSFLKDLKEKNSLSGNNTISGFYRGIGQKRISKQKRARANRIFKELRKDGFSPEEIAFAVKWTLKNAKQQPYDFSLIRDTIGQAIAAREKTEAEAKEIEERERAAAEKTEQRERKEKEREEIENYKESLDPEEREALRNRAETELRESEQFKEEYITDILIEVRENRILREKLNAENKAEIEGETE